MATLFDMLEQATRSATDKAKGIAREWSAKGVDIDPKFDERVKEQSRIENFNKQYLDLGTQDAPVVSIADFEGRPFISTMSDRTQAGGILTGIGGTELNTPIPLQGGQGFMFENPGMVWASAPGVVNKMGRAALEMKKEYGQDPIFLPWRMAASGGDYATMPGEAMLSYAQTVMGKKDKARLDKLVASYIPGWKGVDNPQSLIQFQDAPGDIRKELLQKLDRDFRNDGGLNIGETRLAVTEPKQVGAPVLGLQNVGEVFAGKPLIPQSGHSTYEAGLPGRGIGILEQNITAADLPSNVVQRRNMDPANWKDTDRRALEVNVAKGIIDDKMLKRLQDTGKLSLGMLVLRGMLDPSPASAAEITASIAQSADKEKAAQDVSELAQMFFPVVADFLMPTRMGDATMTGRAR
jgi:hypothetical protein